MAYVGSKLTTKKNVADSGIVATPPANFDSLTSQLDVQVAEIVEVQGLASDVINV